MLTVFTLGLGAPRGATSCPTPSLSPPPQPNNEVDCRAMLRELLLLALILVLIIAGILIQLWR
jgi:cytochrome b561